MKAIILLVPALLLVGCAGGEVVRPCRWNGEGGTNGSEGDAE